MEKVIAVFHSFEEAEQADKDYYRSLTPDQRMQILFDLRNQWPVGEHAESSFGLARVYKIVEFE